MIQFIHISFAAERDTLLAKRRILFGYNYEAKN